jgi:GT2 family glycosyltransferase
MEVIGSDLKRDGTVKILAVVVLYKLAPENSPTMKSLSGLASCLPDNLELSILVWDNTPGGQTVALPGHRYIAAPDNPGLAQAYNTACEIAAAEGFDWLLTLDQDTVLPLHFLTRIRDIIASLPVTSSVAAIVPLVTDGDRTISPYYLLAGAFPRWYPAGFLGTASQATYAVNSTSTLRVSAIQQIGGYDPLFPLDLSDINLFHKLHAASHNVFIAGDLRVHHELALLDKEKRMNLDRYRDGLLDECAFYDLELGPLARIERLVRLAGRAFKDTFEPNLIHFRTATLDELRRRILTSRSQRIATWRRWAQLRLKTTQNRILVGSNPS